MGQTERTTVQVTGKQKVGIVGYLALILAVCFFSGAFGKLPGAWKVLDFNTIFGEFGKITKDAAPGFTGTGGTGVRQGFAQSLSIAPGVWLAVAFIAVVDYLDGLKAAQELLTPILRLLLGIPGLAALPLVASWQSSDTAAALNKNLIDQGLVSEDERDILTMYQFSADATIGMYYSNGAMLFPFLGGRIGLAILVIMVMKVVGANFMRFYIRWAVKRDRTSDRPISA